MKAEHRVVLPNTDPHSPYYKCEIITAGPIFREPGSDPYRHTIRVNRLGGNKNMFLPPDTYIMIGDPVEVVYSTQTIPDDDTPCSFNNGVYFDVVSIFREIQREQGTVKALVSTALQSAMQRAYAKWRAEIDEHQDSGVSCDFAI